MNEVKFDIFSLKHVFNITILGDSSSRYGNNDLNSEVTVIAKYGRHYAGVITTARSVISV